MQIRCDNCQAAYDVDPPAGSPAALVEMMFRCTSCGRTFPISFGEPAVTSVPEAVATPAADSEGQGLLLKQDGKVYHVQDMAKLQRWIAERRVIATDEVSRDGGVWQAVGKIPELSIFFQLLDQADQLDEAAPEEVSEFPDVTGSTEHTDVIVEPEGLGVSLPPVELSLPEEPPEEDLALEGIPDESELPPPLEDVFGPDDPTMDLGEEVHSFFTQESALNAGADQALFDAHTEEYNPDDDPDFVWVAQRRRQTVLWWVVLFVIGTGIGMVVFDYLNQQDEVKNKTTTTSLKPTPPPPPDEAPAAEEADPAKAAKAAKAEIKAAKAKAPKAEERKEKKEKKEKKDEDGKKSARSEIEKGWKATDAGKWSEARTHFKAALAAGGGTEARFGMARAMEEQGDEAGAARHYCKVVKSSRGGEAKSVSERRLKKLDHTCP